MSNAWRACIVLLLALAALTTRAADPPVIELLIFSSKDCAKCGLIEEASIKAFALRLKCRIDARRYDVGDLTNYKRLVLLERRTGDTDNDLPVVYLGKHVLGGVEEIEQDLERLTEEAAHAGGSKAPAVPTDDEVTEAFGPPPTPGSESSAGPLRLAYFEEPGCRECRRVEYMLREAESRRPIKVRRFLITRRENKVLLEAVCERAGIPEADRLVTPAVFVGHRGLVRDGITDDAFNRLIEGGDDAPVPWASSEAELAAARDRLARRYRNVSMAAVLIGGLVDGVNPCAFATIVFLVTYLAARGRSKGDMLRIGAAFTAGVFVTYLAMGFGLSELLFRLEALPWVAAGVRWALVALVFALAAVSLFDAVAAWRGRTESILLKLPEGVRRRINVLITRRTRSRWLVPASFALGAVISALELACTGQVYLPLIQYMLDVSARRLQTVGLLLVYNLGFIAPLVVVFAAAFFGLRSERLQQLFKQRIALVKLLLALFFAGLGTLMLVTV